MKRWECFTSVGQDEYKHIPLPAQLQNFHIIRLFAVPINPATNWSVVLAGHATHSATFQENVLAAVQTYQQPISVDLLGLGIMGANTQMVLHHAHAATHYITVVLYLDEYKKKGLYVKNADQ